MEIGNIRGMESMSGRPMGQTQPADPIVKGIQDEISEVQRQKQQLSSKEDLPATEKVKKRQELQQKISDLNRELRQRQVDARKEQQKEARAKESQASASTTRDADNKGSKTKDVTIKAATEQKTETNDTKTNALKTNDVKTDSTKPKTTGRTDTQNDNVHNTGASAEKTGTKTSQDKASKLEDFDIPEKERKAIVKSGASREQARRQETVIARIEGGIAILKSEIKLDEARGMDVEKKKEELKKQTEKLQKAADAQFSPSDQFSQAAEKTAPAVTGTAANLSNDNVQAAQQPLFKDIAVSLTI